MIGPAELYDLMLDHAETLAVKVKPNRAESLSWPVSVWLNALERVAQSQTRSRSFALQEREGRFVVVEVKTGQDVYPPPDFLKPRRAEFASLLASLEAGAFIIDAVARFEGRTTRVDSKVQHLALAA